MNRVPILLLVTVVLLAGCANPMPDEASSTAELSQAPTISSQSGDASAQPTTVPRSETAQLSTQLEKVLELPFIPHDITVSGDGSIYAVELGSPMVHKLDHEGKVEASWGGAGSEPGQFSFDPPPDAPPLNGGFIVTGAGDKVYVSDSYNNRVQVFDAQGVFLEMWEGYGDEGTPFNSPGPISADAAGNIYVADFGGVHQFNGGGEYLQTISAAGELALDSQGNLFTVVAFENIAMKVPASGDEPLIWGGEGTGDGQFQTPMWVVVGPDDTVYISDHSGRVQRFDGDGSFLGGWSRTSDSAEPLAGPSPLALSGDGRIYVAAKDHKAVYQLTASD